MSGAISAVIQGVAGIATTLFGGGDQSVSLGGFVFAGYEVPETIRWGGSQQMTVHKLVGGTRVIDTLGRDDMDISWSGIFLSADASDRADQLDQLRALGLMVELAFAGRDYDVVVKSFSADQRKLNHVPYSIVCTVLQDNTADLKAADPTVLSSVMDDLSSALGFDVPEALTTAQQTLATVSPVLTPIVALVGGTAAATAVAAGLGAAQGLTTAAAQLADGQIAGITNAAASVGNVIGAVTPEKATANMQAALAATATAAYASAMTAYVGRATLNVERA